MAGPPAAAAMTRSSDSWAAAFLAAAMRDAAAVEIEADSGRAVGLDPAAALARWRLPQFAPRAAASAATRCGVEELGGMARGSLVGAVGITDLPAAQNSPCGWLLRGEMTRPAVAPPVLRILARRKRCCRPSCEEGRDDSRPHTPATISATAGSARLSGGHVGGAPLAFWHAATSQPWAYRQRR